MARLTQTEQSRRDLLDIWRYIAADNPDAADRVLDRIGARMNILTLWPLAGRAWPAIAADARMLVERPYLILYRTTLEGVQIVRVVHGARDIHKTLFADGLDPE